MWSLGTMLCTEVQCQGCPSRCYSAQRRKSTGGGRACRRGLNLAFSEDKSWWNFPKFSWKNLPTLLAHHFQGELTPRVLQHHEQARVRVGRLLGSVKFQKECDRVTLWHQQRTSTLAVGTSRHEHKSSAERDLDCHSCYCCVRSGLPYSLLWTMLRMTIWTAMFATTYWLFLNSFWFQ